MNLSKEWEEFKKDSVPPHATEAQINCMRFAFFSGALSCVNLFSNAGKTNFDNLINTLISELELYITSDPFDEEKTGG
jgi:hypothetical protein